MRRALLALTLLFLATHAACLPATLGDIDAINFALGVRDFDVARHQPHPPGYPVFIAIAKVTTATFAAIGVPAVEVRGLAIWSALAGAALLPLLFCLFRELTRDHRLAAWAAVVTVVSPLFWFNALRPLSDLTGLAMVVAAQLLFVTVILRRPPPSRPAVWLIAGAFVAGLAIGVRSQSFVLTLPLLGLALVVPRTGLRATDRLWVLVAATAGGLLWIIPLFLASGGMENYLVALGSQAGEDFGGVVMLWTARSARVAIDAIRYSFLWPWGSLVAGWLVMAAAAAGLVRMARAAPASLAVLFVAFAPYAAFHLLFQETPTTRYALPLLIPVALLAVYALAGLGRYAVHGGCAALATWCLVTVLPAARTYHARPAPHALALGDAIESAGGGVIAMHAVMLRPEEWYHRDAPRRIMRERHGREVSALVDRWRQEPDLTVRFLASPRRSDLARLDPRSRELTRTYDWGIPELPFLGGVRPAAIQLFTMRPPGWMLGDGWAVTAEVGGESERRGGGPHRKPSTAWVRSRPGATMLMIGGRNLAAGEGATAQVAVSIAGRVVHTFAARPGFFIERLVLPAGSLAGGDAYLPMEVTAVPLGPAPVGVSLEQFDLQPGGVPMIGALEGWQEPEYNPATGRSWRWMSDRASFWVRQVGRDVTLRLSAESPLRYFDGPPALRLTVAGQTIAELSPSADFTWEVRIPASLLTAGNEVVSIESDRSFVAGGGDQRKLALRVYAFEIN